MIGETWRLSRGRGLFHYNKMEKTCHNPYWNCTTEQEGQLSEKWSSSQNSLDEMEETVDVWTISQRVTRCPLCVSAIRKPLLRKANMKSLSLPEDMTLHFSSLSQKKSFGAIEIKLNLFKQNHVQDFLVFWNCLNI